MRIQNLTVVVDAGCIGYVVWVAGKQVSYFGRKGEVHIELFPSE